MPYSVYQKRKLSFNYLYVSLIILWKVVQLYIGVDGKGRIPFLITIVYFIWNISKCHRLFSSIQVYWSLWVIYALINTFIIQGSPMEQDIRISFFTNVLAGPLLIFAITEEYKNNTRFCLSFLSYILSVYVVGGLFVTPQNIDGGQELSALGNMLPITVVFAVFIFSLKYIRKDISFNLFMIILAICVFLILISSTRKAFGGVIIILFFTYLACLKKFSLRAFVNMIILFVSVWSLANLLESTVLFERMHEAKERGIDSEFSNNWFLLLMDDRAIMYMEGWKIFFDNFWLGIGLRNFINKGYSILTLHTEYMVQLAECGFIGTLLYVNFLISLAKGLMKVVYNRYQLAFVCFGGYISILFMSLTTWTYDQPIFFIGYGLIIAYIKSYQNREAYENSNS